MAQAASHRAGPGTWDFVSHKVIRPVLSHRISSLSNQREGIIRGKGLGHAYLDLLQITFPLLKNGKNDSPSRSPCMSLSIPVHQTVSSLRGWAVSPVMDTCCPTSLKHLMIYNIMLICSCMISPDRTLRFTSCLKVVSPPPSKIHSSTLQVVGALYI